jgi:hypothetical protein
MSRETSAIPGIARYRKDVAAFRDYLATVPEGQTAINLAPDKWSLKQIIGHLIDSASNNHQRFVRLRLAPELIFPKYDNEAWLSAQDHNGFPWKDLVSFWSLYNEFLLHLISALPSDSLSNVWINGAEKTALGELVRGYYEHLGKHVVHFKERRAEIAKA